MLSELVAVLVPALAVVVGATIGAPRLGRDVRSYLKRDLELLAALPTEAAESRRLLRTDIERRIDLLVGENPARRSPSYIVLGFVSSGLAGGCIYLVAMGGLWLLMLPFVLIFVLFGIAGVALGLPKVPRDEKGNAIK